MREFGQPSQVSLKTVFTVCFGVLVVAATVTALAYAVVAVVLSGAALLVALALDHVVGALERRGVRRPLAIAAVVGAGTVAAVALVLALVPAAYEQGRQLVADAPALLRAARGSRVVATLDARLHLTDRLPDLERRLPELLEGAATPKAGLWALAAVGGVLSALAGVVTIAFLSVFMLAFGKPIARAALAEARPSRRPIYLGVLREIRASIGGYLTGMLIICGANAVFTTIFLALDRLRFFLPLGIVAGLSSMVPYAGPFAVGSAVTLIALALQGPWHGLATALWFVIYGQIEGNVLAPLVFRRTVHVNPLVVMLSVLFFGELAGVMGAIAAVPIGAALQIVTRALLRIRREQLDVDRAG